MHLYNYPRLSYTSSFLNLYLNIIHNHNPHILFKIFRKMQTHILISIFWPNNNMFSNFSLLPTLIYEKNTQNMQEEIQ